MIKTWFNNNAEGAKDWAVTAHAQHGLSLRLLSHAQSTSLFAISGGPLPILALRVFTWTFVRPASFPA